MFLSARRTAGVGGLARAWTGLDARAKLCRLVGGLLSVLQREGGRRVERRLPG